MKEKAEGRMGKKKLRTHFVDPGQSSHLAVSIQDMIPSEDYDNSIMRRRMRSSSCCCCCISSRRTGEEGKEKAEAEERRKTRKKGHGIR